MGFRKRRVLLLVWTAALLLLLFSSGLGEETTAAGVSIVVNPSVSGDEITRDALKKIFTGQQVVWGDGRSIRPALLNEGAVHKEFVVRYVEKTPNQFQTYWRKMVFTGEGVQPVIFDSEEKLIEYVAGTEGAIGYVSPSARTAKIKTLQVREK